MSTPGDEGSTGNCDTPTCDLHFHTSNTILSKEETGETLTSRQLPPEEQNAESTGRDVGEPSSGPRKVIPTSNKVQNGGIDTKYDPRDYGFRRIIRNFTPS